MIRPPNPDIVFGDDADAEIEHDKVVHEARFLKHSSGDEASSTTRGPTVPEIRLRDLDIFGGDAEIDYDKVVRDTCLLRHSSDEASSTTEGPAVPSMWPLNPDLAFGEDADEEIEHDKAAHEACILRNSGDEASSTTGLAVPAIRPTNLERIFVDDGYSMNT